MRVLEVTHYAPPHMGGIERVVDALSSALRERGHDVHWVAASAPLKPSTDALVSRVHAPNLLESWLGIPYPLWTPRSLRLLRERVGWADVVHVHDCLYIGSVAAAHACHALRKPLLITQHVGYVPYGPILDVLQRSAYVLLGLRTLRMARAVAVCSPHVAEWLAELGLSTPVRVIQNATDVGRFRVPSADERKAARRRLRVPEDGKVLLFVGRLVAKKGVPRVVAVHSALARKDHVTLLVVGDGPLSSVLDRRPGVVRLPRLSPAEMPDAYAAADAFLLPSRGEGLPIAAQEAMLSGLGLLLSADPAFVTNFAGAPGVIMEDDDRRLTESADSMLRSPPDKRTLAAWGRARWSADAFVSAYERLLEDLRVQRTRA